MIRVLNVISGLNNAGTEAVVMNYYRNIDRNKIQFDFLVLDEKENLYYEAEIEKLGGRIYKLPAFKKNPIRSFLGRRKFFRRHKYEIVEVHAPSATRYAYCKSAKKSGVKKVIFHIHNTCYDNGPIIKYARKQLEKYCDEIVTCSQMAAVSVLGREADKVVYNAIDCRAYAFNTNLRKNIREKYAISNEKIVIGHVGRFSEQKNHKFLLEVFSDLNKKNENYILILKGFGELEEQLKEIVYQHNLQDKVIFASDEFSAQELYNAFDIFLLPSLYEGLPVVIIEAQVNGLKPIVSKAITPEADFGGFLTVLDLDINEWVKSIENIIDGRTENTELIFNSNYNIEIASKKREEDYLSING